MDADETFLFDLTGYLVVRNVLSAEEVAAANAVVDRYQDQRTGHPDGGRRDLQHMLGFPAADRAPFASMLAHPKLVRHLNTIVGPGFRMDHAPTLITMEQGDPAAGLHGSSGYDSWTGELGFNPLEYYLWRNGRMHNGLVVAAFALVDCKPGDGGLAVIPGTHKSNVKSPESMRQHQEYQEFVKQITCNAGDAILFTEALTHGTLAWNAPHQRRSVLFRYSPANLAYAGGRHEFDAENRQGDAWPASWLEGLSDAQLAVLEPPYHPRLDRPVLGDDGELSPSSAELLSQRGGWKQIGHNGPPPPQPPLARNSKL